MAASSGKKQHGKRGRGDELEDAPPVELVQMGGIAELLNVTRQRADSLSNDIRQEFPKPVGRIGNGRVWRRRDIVRWAKRKGRDVHG